MRISDWSSDVCSSDLDAQGAISLDEAWKIWAADCEPHLCPSLFDDALVAYRSTLQRAIAAAEHKPIVIAADSREEALTFLSAGFSPQDAELGKFRDRVIIFREVGALSKLAAQVGIAADRRVGDRPGFGDIARDDLIGAIPRVGGRTLTKGFH